MRSTIRSYEEAAAFLGQSPSKGTGQRGTRVIRLSETVITVRYHQTDVVTYFHPDSPEGRSGHLATIRMGGYATPTTVDRINEYAPAGVQAFLEDEDTVIVSRELAVRDEVLQLPTDSFRVFSVPEPSALT